MLVVSHEMGFEHEVSNRVMMDGGQVMEIGSPDKRFDRPQRAWAREFVGKILRG